MCWVMYLRSLRKHVMTLDCICLLQVACPQQARYLDQEQLDQASLQGCKYR
jgi:hypothetical protein